MLKRRQYSPINLEHAQQFVRSIDSCCDACFAGSAAVEWVLATSGAVETDLEDDPRKMLAGLSKSIFGRGGGAEEEDEEEDEDTWGNSHKYVVALSQPHDMIDSIPLQNYSTLLGPLSLVGGFRDALLACD